MSLLDSISQFVKDPPPNYVFEFSDAGIAYARPSESGTRELGFAALDPENFKRALDCVVRRAPSVLVIAHR